MTVESYLPPVLADFGPGDWQRLAGQYGSPFYLLDADAVRRRTHDVRTALGNHASIYLAVKTNPNLGLMRELRDCIDGVDISSGGELAQAMLAGVAPGSMSFAGPGKTAEELEAAIAHGVGCISVESWRELNDCASIAARLGQVAKVILRINLQEIGRSYGLKMCGRPTQFGIDEEDLQAAGERLKSVRPHVECVGIHSYVGSQCFDIADVVTSTTAAFRLADQLSNQLGTQLVKLNLGGGFGVAQGVQRKELDMSGLAAALQPLLAEYKRHHGDTELIFELGRYLLADAGIYVTRVVSTKQSRGRQFVICDGGLNHQLAAAGTFGAALRSNFPLRNLTSPNSPDATFHIAGASCNPTDLLGVDVQLPAPVVGDLLGVLHSGAYGLTASPVLFLGHDTPAELVRSRGNVVLGRRRHSILDFN